MERHGQGGVRVSDISHTMVDQTLDRAAILDLSYRSTSLQKRARQRKSKPEENKRSHTTAAGQCCNILSILSYLYTGTCYLCTRMLTFSSPESAPVTSNYRTVIASQCLIMSSRTCGRDAIVQHVTHPPHVLPNSKRASPANPMEKVLAFFGMPSSVFTPSRFFARRICGFGRDPEQLGGSP